MAKQRTDNNKHDKYIMDSNNPRFPAILGKERSKEE